MASTTSPRLLVRILVLCGLTVFISSRCSAQQMHEHTMPEAQHDSDATNLPQMPGMMMQPTNLIESQLNRTRLHADVHGHGPSRRVDVDASW